MSTYCALHVRATEPEPLLRVLETWLQEKLGGAASRERLTEFPRDLYSRDHFFPDELSPSTFVIGEAPVGWVTIHYNSFCEVTELAQNLSSCISALVVTVMAQSVTEAYFIQIVENGRVLRTLYHAGDSGEWVRNEGEPLAFEPRPLGTNISQASEPLYVFGREEAVEYCRHLGLEVWGRQTPSTWLRITGNPEGRVDTRPDTAPETPRGAKKPPWWKFW